MPRHDHWEWWKRDGFKSKSLIITNCPAVKLLARGAPYPTFEIDGSYHPTDVLSVRLRTGDLGEAPHLWDEKSSFLGRTYPDAELKYPPSVDWWKRTIEPKAKFEGEMAKIDATRGVRYEGAINNTGFLRLKVKVTKPGRLLAEEFPHLPEGMVPMCYPDGRPRDGRPAASARGGAAQVLRAVPERGRGA